MKGKKHSPIILVGISLLGTSLVLSGCGTKSSVATTSVQRTPVNVETVSAEAISQTLSFNGTITPYLQTSLSAATQGMLVAVMVRQGHPKDRSSFNTGGLTEDHRSNSYSGRRLSLEPPTHSAN